jgi:hypothetical protein
LEYFYNEIDPGDFSNNMTTSQDNLPAEEPMGTSEEEDNET